MTNCIYHFVSQIKVISHATISSFTQVAAYIRNSIPASKFSIALVAFLGSVFLVLWDQQIWKAFRSKRSLRESRIVLPSLNDSIFEFPHLNIPNALIGIAILLATVFCYQLADGIIFVYFAGQVNPRPSFGEVIAISVAATAILFPLFGLIIGYNSDEGGGIFSNPEVLLRHALAFPLSLVLVSLVGNMAFETHYFWAQIVSVITLLIAGFVLFRLLEAMFVPKVWNDTEKNMISSTVSGATREIASMRMASNLTFRNIESLKPFVSNLISYRSDDGDSEIIVKADTLGIVEEIDDKLLQVLVSDLKALTSPVTPESQPQLRPTETQSTRTRGTPSFQIVLRANPGDEIVEEDRELVKLYLPKWVNLNDSQRGNFTKRLYRCFKIAPVGNRFQHRDVLDRTLERIRHAGRTAIRDGNIGVIKKIKDVFEQLTKGFITTFTELGISYSREEVKNEVPFFGKDWLPLSEMLSCLSDFQEIVLSTAVTDRRLRQEVLYTPLSLSMIAYRAKEQLTFTKFIQMALQQIYWIRDRQQKDLVNIPREWVSSILEHSIRYDLERDARQGSKHSFALEAARTAFDALLYLGKSSIDWCDQKELGELLMAVHELPNLFQFEDVESELNLALSVQKFIHDEQSRLEQEEKIRDLRVKSELREIFKAWRQEVCIGLGTYALLQLDSKGAESPHGEKKELYPLIQNILNYFPSDLEQVVQLNIRINKLGVSKRWGWEFWEKIPTRFAKALESPQYERRFLALVFLRAAQALPEQYTIEKWKLQDIWDLDTFDFSDTPGGIRSTLPQVKEQADTLGISPTEGQFKLLISIFDQIRTTAKLNSDLKLAQTDLSQEKIKIAKENFDSTFELKTILRHLFKRKTTSDSKTVPELSWGINLLVPREYFTETEVHFPEAGTHYAEGMASSEDEYIFEQLNKAGLQVQAGGIDSLVKKLIESESQVGNLLILTSRDLFSMRLLRTDQKYRMNNEFSPERKPARPVGFYRYNESEIPVYQIFIRNAESREMIVVCDKNSIVLEYFREAGKEYLPKSGFIFKINDPKMDTVLAGKLVSGNYDYLKDVSGENKNKMAPKLVGLEILEKVEVKVENSNSVLIQPLASENP